MPDREPQSGDDDQAAVDAAVARSLAAGRLVLGEWARNLDNGGELGPPKEI
jgi:hypothetical protein